MQERYRIYIDLPVDRCSVVAILAKNGYTVREGKEKVGNKNRWFVEYWREAV